MSVSKSPKFTILKWLNFHSLFQEALLSGIYDVELKSLENKAALKLLQNQAAAKYVKCEYSCN